MPAKMLRNIQIKLQIINNVGYQSFEEKIEACREKENFMKYKNCRFFLKNDTK